MAWCPFAIKMELQPESDSQPAIIPTQFIYHSIAAPWTPERTYEFWRDSTNLESHFGLGFDGRLAQYIGTETRADACYLANRRPDGTGAISLESASNLEHSDPWTDEQIETNIQIGVWAHQRHGIPLRICRSWDDPGFGYHRLWPEWAKGGTDCPGDARVRQFREVVFPGIVARANGQNPPEEDMPTAIEIAKAVWDHRENNPVEGGAPVRMGAVQRYMDVVHSKQNAAIAELEEQLASLTAKVDALETTGLTAAQIAAIAKAVNDDAATRLAS